MSTQIGEQALPRAAAKEAKTPGLKPEVEVACVVCGGNTFEIICSAHEIEVQREYLRAFHRRRLRPEAPPSALADRAEFTQDYSTNVEACRSCGLVLRNPRPSRKAIFLAYRRDHYGPERLQSLFEAQLEWERPRARALRRWLPSGARVAEVGSFVGGFLAAGREQGWEMLGVDPGEEVDDFCARHGLPVFKGTLDEAPLLPASLDCVAIWNTFDQMPDPHPTLRAARRLLHPGGLLAVRVPNGRCFRACTHWLRRARHTPLRPLAAWLLCAMAWNNLLAFPYLYGYSVPTLDRLLARYGLERVGARGDTLVRLADAQTKRWAAWEERLSKAAFHLAARMEALHPRCQFTLAPWLDVLYRLPA
ncbi:MAG TPA: methyltransferase domain-containing protein [Chthonomonadaceae bacterium]|nr:methyltransferase domain-containing protein [Chthonomonadaceae bacterium]